MFILILLYKNRILHPNHIPNPTTPILGKLVAPYPTINPITPEPNNIKTWIIMLSVKMFINSETIIRITRNPVANPRRKNVKIMNLYPYKHSAAPRIAKNTKKKYLLLDKNDHKVESSVGHPY